MYDWDIDTQLVKQAFNAPIWHAARLNSCDFTILDGVVPLLLWKRDRFAHLWNGWKPKRRQDEAIGLSACDADGRLLPITLS